MFFNKYNIYLLLMNHKLNFMQNYITKILIIICNGKDKNRDTNNNY